MSLKKWALVYLSCVAGSYCATVAHPEWDLKLNLLVTMIFGIVAWMLLYDPEQSR